MEYYRCDQQRKRYTSIIKDGESHFISREQFTINHNHHNIYYERSLKVRHSRSLLRISLDLCNPRIVISLTVSDRDQNYRSYRHKYLDTNEETAGFGMVQQRGSHPAGGPAREAT
jgi:hypothetical protein